MERSETAAGDVVEVRAERPVAAGAVLAREPTGRIVLVEGVLPGELATVEVTRVRRRHLEGRIVDVVTPSPDRREPPCPAVDAGCGGCDLQHVSLEAQPELKRMVVHDALVRLGGVSDPEVSVGPALLGPGRTTVRAAVDRQGRAGFRARRSHDVVVSPTCMVAHPRVEELLVDGRYTGCEEVVLRVGNATGERLVLASPSAGGVRVPDDVWVIGADELAEGGEAWIHEEVAGRRWRVSARSFFQARSEGAEALVDAVRSTMSVPPDDAESTFVDLYTGVGLFAGALADRWPGPIVAVERSASSAADARMNLADLARVEVISAAVERWTPIPAALVVADPARAGLGSGGVAIIDRTGAPEVQLVSCDPAALGRDARLLGEVGFVHRGSRLVDLFEHNHHVEVVTRFSR